MNFILLIYDKKRLGKISSDVFCWCGRGSFYFGDVIWKISIRAYQDKG